MAGKPQKMRGKYYSRIYIQKGNGKYLEKLVPLNTTNKLEADSRMVIVRQAESAIKLGKKVSFPWNNETNKIEIVHYSISAAISDYLRYKRSEQLKNSYISRISTALEHFLTVVGTRAAVKEITIEHIDMFKEYFSYNNRHEPTTINTNLDKIKAFLRWLNDRNKILKVPKIKKLRVAHALPKYITDDEWSKIMDLNKVYRKHYDHYESFDEQWKEAFYFYRATGCRLSEPFIGELHGNWLIVNPKEGKVNKTRDIFIPDELIPILNDMRARTGIMPTTTRDRIQSYSKKFKYACEALRINKHFYCLRHTFAVRRYLETGDIYLVAKEMGHSTVKTTEIYTKFDIRRLEQDFPSIKRVQEYTAKTRNHIKSYTEHRLQLDSKGATVVGKV